MQQRGATLILISFIAIAVFGILAMGHTQAHGDSCLATMAGNATCATENPLASLNFHLSTFKSFSQTTLATFLTLALMLLMLLWRPAFLILVAAQASKKPSHNYSLQDTQLPHQRMLQRWLARHELRDPDASRRARARKILS